MIFNHNKMLDVPKRERFEQRAGRRPRDVAVCKEELLIIEATSIRHINLGAIKPSGKINQLKEKSYIMYMEVTVLEA